MQPRQSSVDSPVLEGTVPHGVPDGVPDEHDVRRQLALAIYVLRDMRGLPVESIPSRVELDVETQNYYREFVKRRRASKPPSVWDVFKPPLWLPGSRDE